MSKWQISDAAAKRVQDRVVETLRGANGKAWEVLLEAVAPEDFARPRRVAEELIQIWMRNGELLYFCSRCFHDVCFERTEFVESSERLVEPKHADEASGVGRVTDTNKEARELKEVLAPPFIRRAIALVEEARRKIEQAEELLGAYEGLTDDLGSADHELGTVIEVLEEALEE